MRLAGGVTIVAILGACGSSAHTRSVPPAFRAATTIAPSTSSTKTTSTTVPAYVSYVATATVPQLDVFAAPNARMPVRTLENPWYVDPATPAATVPQVFLVVTRRADGWIEVLLPVRPNGTTGWVRAIDVTLASERPPGYS